MHTFVPEYVVYWIDAGLLKFVRAFWVFFVFELTRYYLFEYIVLFMHWRSTKKNHNKRVAARMQLFLENPLVSILVPGKNEGQHLFKLVQSLNEQTYKNYEIIVIDDGSDDSTAIIGRNFEKQGLIHLFIRNDVRGGKASAANLALNCSKGAFVVHLDADCSFDRDAIENIIIPFYMNPQIGAVGGNIKARNYRTNLCCKLQAIEYLKTVFLSRVVTSYLNIYEIISGAFGAFKREALVAVGGWDVGPGLDGDITIKIRKSGFRVVFEPLAVCLTDVPATFKALTRQRRRWYRSIIRFRLRRHNDVLYPNANFSWPNFFSVFENLFYNIVLDVVWWVYLIDIVIHLDSLLKYILPMSYTLYLVMGYSKMTAIYLFSERSKEELYLWLYFPFMPLYSGFYLRFVRSIAYIKEYFFKRSYKDPWNPRKSSLQAQKTNQ